jgi:adenylate kinase
MSPEPQTSTASSSAFNHLDERVQFFPFIAPPNGGKGTQTSRLSKQFQMPRLDMGALLRAITKEDSELARVVNARLSQGQLVSLDIVMDVLVDGIAKQLKTLPEGRPAGFILDGFPRSLEQSEALLALCDKTGAKVAQAFYLDVPEAVIVERASNRRICQDCGEIHNVKTKPLTPDGRCTVCGSSHILHRVDDQPDKVQNRLRSFAEETLPILERFESRNLLTRVDANREMDVITDELSALLQQHLALSPAS